MNDDKTSSDCTTAANPNDTTMDSGVDFGLASHPADLALMLERESLEDSLKALLALPQPRRAETFSFLRLEFQSKLAKRMGGGDLVAIVTEMNADDRADLFNSLTPEEQQRLLSGLALEEREDDCRLARHAEGTAGAIMTSDFATLSADMTTREAIDALRREAPGKETIYRPYILRCLVRRDDSGLCFPGILPATPDRQRRQCRLAISHPDGSSACNRRCGSEDWRNLLVRELLIAMALGVTMALLVFPVGLMRGGPEIALVVGMTMVIVVIVGSLAGMPLPFLLSRLRLDLAAASAPRVTALSDAVEVLVYFSIATLVLSP